MRTTLKRRIGRWEQATGNGRAAAQPSLARTRIRHYEQPEANGRVLRAVGHFLLNTLLVLSVVAGGAAGGLYLWAHQELGQTAAKSPDVIIASRSLVAPLPKNPVIALVVGSDRRAGMGGDHGRSDTLMLVRADPRKATQSITLLSFPRDLRVPLYCKPGVSIGSGKINAAYSSCENGAEGSLLTVKNLTGLPINYEMVVYLRGFRQIVNHMGGVWMDIDRRYYNHNLHTIATNYANINLQPGYQRLNGSNALDYVRYRHGDSDLFRNTRQQAFVRSFREQASKLSKFDYIGIVNTIAHNIEIGKNGNLSLKTMLKYAQLAYGLQNGRLIQVKIDNVGNAPDGSSDLVASESSIQQAVAQFESPDLTAADQAAKQNHVGHTAKSPPAAAPAPEKTTVLALNASGTAGLARDTSTGLAQRGYKIVQPTGGVAANYPGGANIWHSIVYFDLGQSGSKAAANQLATFFDAASVRPIDAKIAPLANGAMVVAALGETFDGTLPPIVPKVELPTVQPPRVRIDPGVTAPAMRRIQRHFYYRLEAPSRIESSSYLVDSPRVYWMVPKQKTVRLTFKMSGYLTGYWGIQETRWADAPVLAGTHSTLRIRGRSFDYYYQGVHLHMIVLRQNGASYWVVNTLDDLLSNETMIAIAKGLRPVAGHYPGQHKASPKRAKAKSH